MILHLVERAWIFPVTRHYNTCMDNANGLYGSLAIIGDEFPPDENQTNISELSVAKSKLKLLDVKQKAWRKSGLGVAFRRKSNIVK